MADDGSAVTGKRSAQNSAMLDTAFLYGGSAVWIEKMQAAYAQNPNAVPESWRDFFRELGDGSEDAARNADGASWKRERWPKPRDADEVAAFDGNWSMLETKIADKVKGAKPAATAEEVA
ncbi:MAG: 2-oxoglutarate dehydrogenase E1 component, partial [Henriciella sp.]